MTDPERYVDSRRAEIDIIDGEDSGEEIAKIVYEAWMAGYTRGIDEALR
jgi:hypothetical protein